MDALRKIPQLTVFSTHTIGKGFPDIIVGYKNVNYMFEIKDGNKVASAQKLTEDEVKFHAEWKGQISIAKNLNDILKIVLSL